MNHGRLLMCGLLRRPTRTVLTGICIVIAFVLFGLLQPVSKLFTQGTTFTGDDRLLVSNKYSFTGVLPTRYIPQISAVPGVNKVAHQTYFGGTYKDPSFTFTRFAVPPNEYFSIYEELILPEEQLREFAATRTAVVVGRQTAELLNLRVGDKIPIVPDVWPNKDSAAWEFDLVGIFDGATQDVDTTRMFINYEFFNEYRAFGNDYVSSIIIEIDPSHSPDGVAGSVDSLFTTGSWATKTATEMSHLLNFAQQYGDIALMVTSVLAAVFFTILLLTANTQVQSFRERISEVGVLKSLGFKDGYVFCLLLAESILLTVFCAALGMLFAWFLLNLIVEVIPGGMASSVRLDLEVVGLGFGLAVAVGLGVGLPPALRARRIDIVEALRV